MSLQRTESPVSSRADRHDQLKLTLIFHLSLSI